MNPPVPEKKTITLTCQVDSYRSGWTVVEFLAHRFHYHTADGWKERVADGRVRINGARVEPAARVTRDDAVQYTIEHAEPAVDGRYDVLYEDDDLLCVSKSGNIPVHACGVYITHTLIARLRDAYGPAVNLCHRLDRETSGVVVLAKNREANRVLAGAFARGDVHKEYVAVVVGEVARDAFVVDAAIGKVDMRAAYPDTYRRGKARDLATYLPKRVVVAKGGKTAETRFEVLARGGRYSTLRAIPAQGRTNQIRVHAAHAGYPIVGDKVYMLHGAARDELLHEGLTDAVRAALVAPRQLLHCARLAFTHPVTGQRRVVEAGMPGDMRPFCGDFF